MSDKGIVVDHKESGVRYAISAHNFNEKIHTFVRNLFPHESVLGFKPKAKAQLTKAELEEPKHSPHAPEQATASQPPAEAPQTEQPPTEQAAPETEGSAPADTEGQ